VSRPSDVHVGGTGGDDHRDDHPDDLSQEDRFVDDFQQRPGVAALLRRAADDADGSSNRWWGAVPGPAGVAEVGLHDHDVRVVVDYADPDVVVTVEADLEGAWGALRGGSFRDAVPPLSDLGRAAVLGDDLKELLLSTGARGVGRLERGSLLVRLPATLRAAATADAELEVGAEHLVEAGDEVDELLADPRTRAEVVALIELALDRLPVSPLARALAELVARLRGMGGRPRYAQAGGGFNRTRAMRPPQAATEFAMATPASAAGYGADFSKLEADAIELLTDLAFEAELGRRTVPTVELDPDLEGEVLSTAWDDRHHLSVVVRLAGAPPVPGHTGDAPMWLRVFSAGPRPVLLALAPFVMNRFATASATALVVEVATPDRLLVDVSVSVADGWLPASIREVRRATRLGRSAARATRTGSVVGGLGGGQQWERCAEAWLDAGDRLRASAAMVAVKRPQPPFLTDLLPT